MNEIRKKSNTNDLELIKKAWNSILLNMHEERVHLLKKLSSKYKIFLLSNTNSIHLKEIISSEGEKKWKNCIKIIFSYRHSSGYSTRFNGSKNKKCK